MLRKISMLLTVIAFVAGVGSLLYAMPSSDMNSEHQQFVQAQPGEAHESPVVSEAASKEGVNVGNKICPVSGEKINDKTKATYEYAGKVYNFCCPACIDEFKKDPQKYIKKIDAENNAASGNATQDMKMMQHN